MISEPLFAGTNVYLGACIACALKSAGEIASNRGLESDGKKFSHAKPHLDDGEGKGNPVRCGAVFTSPPPFALVGTSCVPARPAEPVYG